MKIYLAYKYSGADKKVLKENLEGISSSLEELGHTTYAFYRDTLKWGEPDIGIKEIFEIAFSEIRNSDAIFIFLDKNEKSEGMLLEVGYAKALGKKIILAIKSDIERFFVLRAIADTTIEFDDLDDLQGKIKIKDI